MTPIHAGMVLVALGMPGMGELAVIAVMIAVLFGGEKFEEIARMMGKGMREFRRVMNDF